MTHLVHLLSISNASYRPIPRNWVVFDSPFCMVFRLHSKAVTIHHVCFSSSVNSITLYSKPVYTKSKHLFHHRNENDTGSLQRRRRGPLSSQWHQDLDHGVVKHRGRPSTCRGARARQRFKEGEEVDGGGRQGQGELSSTHHGLLLMNRPKTRSSTSKWVCHNPTCTFDIVSDSIVHRLRQNELTHAPMVTHEHTHYLLDEMTKR
jgi:hypothetical protein